MRIEDDELEENDDHEDNHDKAWDFPKMTPGLVVGHKLEEDIDNENNRNELETSKGLSLISQRCWW